MYCLSFIFIRYLLINAVYFIFSLLPSELCIYHSVCWNKVALVFFFSFMLSWIRGRSFFFLIHLAVMYITSDLPKLICAIVKKLKQHSVRLHFPTLRWSFHRFSFLSLFPTLVCIHSAQILADEQKTMSTFTRRTRAAAVLISGSPYFVSFVSNQLSKKIFLFSCKVQILGQNWPD